MHHPAPLLGREMATAVIQTAQHDKRLAGMKFRINNALVPVGSEIRLLVAPEVATRYNPRRADFLGRVTPRYEETKQHVSVLVVFLDARMSRMVVFVISVQFLRRCTGSDIHCYGNREKRVRGVCRWLLIVPVRCLYSEELLSEALIQGV